MAESSQQSDLRIPEDDFQQTAVDREPGGAAGRSDVDLLRQAVMNEKAAPELLHYETDLINRIEQMLDYQVCTSPRR